MPTLPLPESTNKTVEVPTVKLWLIVEEALTIIPPAKVETPLEIVVVAVPLVVTTILPPDTVNLELGLVFPMPTLPVELINILEVACAKPAPSPIMKYPLVNEMSEMAL